VDSKIYQHFPFKGPPKFTQIGIFGLKIYHLATLDGRILFRFRRHSADWRPTFSSETTFRCQTWSPPGRRRPWSRLCPGICWPRRAASSQTTITFRKERKASQNSIRFLASGTRAASNLFYFRLHNSKISKIQISAKQVQLNLGWLYALGRKFEELVSRLN
jgi:hypothetical protein